MAHERQSILSASEGGGGARRGWRLRHWRRNLLDTATRLLERLVKKVAPPPATLVPSHPPGHFYSPFPSLDDIRAREATGLGWREEMGGIDLNADAQVGLFKSLGAYYPEMPFGEERTGGLRYCFQNAFFGYSDAIFLYSVIRHFRPRRIIEVGSGHSSCVMLDTNELFFGGSIECTFIEPYPGGLLSLLKADDRRSLRLLDARVQDVPLATYDELDGNDILFVDSSHVSKIGSDLNHIVFNVLPRLRPGVLVHFHDIFYPFEYPAFFLYSGIA